MQQTSIRIVRLEPMRVASFYAFGESPETAVWDKLAAWAEPKGLLANIEAHPIIGFDNPSPTPASPKYGYELWIKIGTNVEPEGEMRVVEFCGGIYAVTRCPVLGDPFHTIPAAWQQLGEWCKKNNLKYGYHQALEQYLTRADNLDSLVLDLYCPIVEPQTVL